MVLPEITTNPVRYGKVKWTGLAAIIDSLIDEDDLPDLSEISGVVIFKPSVTAVAYPNAVPKFTTILLNRQVNMSDAMLTEQGRRYVKLEANVPGQQPEHLSWTAVFSVGFQGINVKLPELQFALEPNQELDLTDLIGY